MEEKRRSGQDGWRRVEVRGGQGRNRVTQAERSCLPGEGNKGAMELGAVLTAAVRLAWKGRREAQVASEDGSVEAEWCVKTSFSEGE